MAAAQTGTGKTAGFTLPLLQRLSAGPAAKSNQVRALILTPTRELAAQVAESVEIYGKYLSLKSAVVFGGVKINPQMMRLRRGADILVATPGRLLDLHQQNAVKFDALEILVLDEADRMLDMGFIHDIRKIMSVLPKKRQNLLFSATFSEEIRTLAKTFIHNPVEFSVTPRNAAATSVNQSIYPVDKKFKAEVLCHLIKQNQWQQVLVFCRTKHGANKLTKVLESQNIRAAAIHGNKSQGARTKALADFKNGSVRVLVATDIAARGLDIDQLPHVINHDLPNVPQDYVHRIGRTGRAGASGDAISLVSADEFPLLADIERLIQKLIPRQYVDGYEPEHDLPTSKLNTRPTTPAKVKSNQARRPDSDRSKRSGPAKTSTAAAHNPRGRPGKPSTSRPGATKSGSPQTKNNGDSRRRDATRGNSARRSRPKV